jgi:hypothetical protein
MKRLNLLLVSSLVISSLTTNITKTEAKKGFISRFFCKDIKKTSNECRDTLVCGAKISCFAWPVGFIALWGSTFSAQSTFGMLCSMLEIAHCVVDQNDKYWNDNNSTYFYLYSMAKVITIGLAMTQVGNIVKHKSRIQKRLKNPTKLASLIGLGALSVASIIYLTLQQI